jgi:hypothetical protein
VKKLVKELEFVDPVASGRGVNVGKSSGTISVTDLIYSRELSIINVHINFLSLP